jgi:hypothetical protein
MTARDAIPNRRPQVFRSERGLRPRNSFPRGALPRRARIEPVRSAVFATRTGTSVPEVEHHGLDTNLLVYAHRAALPQHRAARRAIERAAGAETGWGISQPSLVEFWSIVTHPASAGRPSSGAAASAFLASLVRDGGAQIWMPGPGFGDRLLHLAVALNVRGPRIFDLQIGLTSAPGYSSSSSSRRSSSRPK